MFLDLARCRHHHDSPLFADSLADFLLAAIIYGFGFGVVQPALQALSVASVPPNRRGAATATYMMGFDLGIGIGSMLWGAIAQMTGYQGIYLCAAVPAGIALVLFLVWSYLQPQQIMTKKG